METIEGLGKRLKELRTERDMSLFPCHQKSPQPCGFEGFYFAIFGIFLLKLYSPLYKGFSRL